MKQGERRIHDTSAAAEQGRCDRIEGVSSRPWRPQKEAAYQRKNAGGRLELGSEDSDSHAETTEAADRQSYSATLGTRVTVLRHGSLARSGRPTLQNPHFDAGHGAKRQLPQSCAELTA